MEEYTSALTSQEFRDKMSRFLDSDSEYVDALEAKFYYGGGSARYMFDMTTKDVITSVDLAVKKQRH